MHMEDLLTCIKGEVTEWEGCTLKVPGSSGGVRCCAQEVNQHSVHVVVQDSLEPTSRFYLETNYYVGDEADVSNLTFFKILTLISAFGFISEEFWLLPIRIVFSFSRNFGFSKADFIISSDTEDICLIPTFFALLEVILESQNVDFNLRIQTFSLFFSLFCHFPTKFWELTKSNFDFKDWLFKTNVESVKRKKINVSSCTILLKF